MSNPQVAHAIQSSTMDDVETYIMLMLADSNLPTGAFVASSGLESFVKHGFLSASASAFPDQTSTTSSRTNLALMEFIQDNIANYARSALPFVSDSHIVVTDFLSTLIGEKPACGKDNKAIIEHLMDLDCLYHSMTLNAVTRRASQSQGVALLTLFSKGFSAPAFPSLPPPYTQSAYPARTQQTFPASEPIIPAMGLLVDEFKLLVRREDTSGHLPICWGILTAALGLPLERSQYLHLFLQARSLLSAAVRLNILGPYAAQQLMLHSVKSLLVAQLLTCGSLRTQIDKLRDTDDKSVVEGAPASTWPLGEILAARHDLQHSRIFNS